MGKIKDASLTPIQLAVIRNKATEKPHTGEYNSNYSKGSYLCKACGKALFRADSKFASSCGWPSFDLALSNAVATKPDADGRRQEIVCAYCDAHLGHVFEGENFTKENRRYCVNSLSLDFVENLDVRDSEEVILAAGCFWGVEHYFKSLPGVLKTEVGYCGGNIEYPSYNQVCTGKTGHLEVIRVLFDPEKISYEEVIKYFFEIHNFSQANGQGPDIGEQYKSAIFYYDEKEKTQSLNLISELKLRGYSVSTKLIPISAFWKAEDYHQNYYDKNKKTPYCHSYTRLFD